MASKYQENQRKRAVKLINNGFYEVKGGGKFMGDSRDFVLLENIKNLYEPIRNDVIKYFKDNIISWWGGSEPTGHVLSSQIACLNHLFLIRNDKEAVLSLLNSFSKNFKDVLKIESDKQYSGYIQFEAVSKNKDLLKEENNTRGSNCTSIDALIYAVHNDNTKWLIPIEWKYTEFYNNLDKSKEKNGGKKRKLRYTTFINNSRQLKCENDKCYYYEPFYQLMRQTLWAERMIETKEIEAENYLHVHVIPKENTDLLDKTYECSDEKMEATWRKHLKDQSKYVIVSPSQLMSGINNNKYQDLIDYLSKRYHNCL